MVEMRHNFGINTGTIKSWGLYWTLDYDGGYPIFCLAAKKSSLRDHSWNFAVAITEL